MNTIVSDALGQKGNFSEVADEFEDVNQLRIVVCGAGGGGGNTVNRLARIGITGAELIAMNTDAQDLKKIDPRITKVLIGAKLTKGLGAGGFPEIGMKAAEASRNEIAKVLEGTHLMFLTAGMGGGTGTGSASVIAEVAKDLGAIVVSIVTFPFQLERSRLDKAREGISRLKKASDTVIVLDNNKLVEYVPNLPIDKAFLVADEVVSRAVKGITETIKEPSLINLDFADIKSVLGGGNVSVISVGDGEGPDKVEVAVKNTLEHPLLDVDYAGAKGALIHITGGPELTIGEANKVGELLTNEFDPTANVMWGARINPRLEDKIEIISIITGVKSNSVLGLASSDSDYVYTSSVDDWGIRSV
ncbi:MAG: cell division protein FtsZ [Candidatus Altiarchaeota archaeon]|nr:cell division protein FtsZ [Candidatus Altiarchaeota archaeon]